tara:strand:- start:3 stop:605 length:603 start_codon:yes stop_codon:yes gene_type:complete
MLSTAQKIMNRIKRKGRGWVFTPQDFVDLASRSNVDVILYRLVQDGDIRRIQRGLYDYPKLDADIGVMAPSVKGVAQAVARKTGDRIAQSGATAANLLGLTTQVPGKVVYTTTGKPKTIPVKNKQIRLVSSPIPDTLLDWNSPVSVTLQALHNLGEKHVTRDHIQKCARHLTDSDKSQIRKNLRYIKSAWLAEIARQLSA